MLDLASSSAAKRRAARDRFHAHLVHQGSVYEATLAAIPHLLALLDAKKTPEKGELLCLLQEAAVGDHTNWIDSRFVAKEGHASVEGRCYTAVARAHENFVALLGDRDSETRAGAAFVLGWLPTRANKTLAKIRAQLAKERDLDVRAGLLLALGMLGSRDDAAPLEGALDEPTKVRVAAAIGRTWLDSKSAPSAVHEAIAEGISSKPLKKTEIPWNWGDLAGLARVVSRTLPKAKVDPEAAMKRLRAARSHEALRDEVEDTLPQLFPKKPSAETLSDAQRAWLSALVEREWRYYRISELLAWRGLPDDHDPMRAFLGMRPKNPRELVIFVGTKSLSVQRAYGSVVRGTLRPAIFLKACGALGPTDTIAATIASVGQFDLSLHAKSVETALDLLSPIAKKHPSDLRSAAKMLAEDADYLMAKVLVLLLHRIHALDASHDRLLVEALFGGEQHEALQAILSALPMPRREKVVLAARPWSSEVRRKRIPEGAWLYLDLAPTPKVVAHTVAMVEKEAEKVPVESAFATLVGFGSIARKPLEAAARKRNGRHRELFDRALSALKD